jgi:hypothetical protein
MTIEVNEKREELYTQKDIHFHQFHAEGSALSGTLRAPIDQQIETQIPVELYDRRGGHLVRSVSEVSIEGLISIKHAETRVSGSKIKEKWVTLATTIVEGLKVFEVFTADRVIAQVSTSHALENGHVPKVTFLGTKFENLQVSGIPVEVTYNYSVCPPPQDNESYLASEAFVQEADESTQAIAERGILFGNALALHQQRRVQSAEVLAVVKSADYKALSYDDKVARLKQLFPDKDRPRITCSLVKSIDISKVRQRFPRVETVANVIVVPDFGAVSLGEVEVGIEMPKPVPYSYGVADGSRRRASTYFELTMLNMELGCIGDATVKVAKSKTNGQSYP